jgi:hypothetical protein
MTRNCNGFIFINLGTVTLVLVVMALWYLHGSYGSGDFQNDLEAMIGDGKKAVLQVQADSSVTTKISALLDDYINYPAGKLSPLPVAASAPGEGGYYGR